MQNARYTQFTVGIYKGKGKGKAIPLHVRTGPACSRRFRLSDFMTIDT